MLTYGPENKEERLYKEEQEHGGLRLQTKQFSKEVKDNTVITDYTKTIQTELKEKDEVKMLRSNLLYE